VAELLVRCKGALQLLDVSDQLPQLKRCAGKRKWLVRDKHQWYSSWEEAEKVGGVQLSADLNCVITVVGGKLLGAEGLAGA
jgi:hypothetical protein